MENKTLLIFLIPIGIAFVFVHGFIGFNIYISLSEWSGLAPAYGFEGFVNYINLFQDPVFWISLKNNLVLLLLIPICLSLGLILAILLDQEIRLGSIFRNIYLLPFALSFIVTATLWRWMYLPGSGVINSLLSSLHLGFLQTAWHTSSGTVMLAIIIGLVWQFTGYTMLILLAGIKAVPENQIKAAKVDGASSFTLYRKVVIPQLKLPFLSAVAVLLIFSLKAFAFIWALTSGGPGYSSHILTIFMFREFYTKAHVAYGSSIATVILIVVMIIVVPYMWLTYRKG